ncbi:MAG: hypothetical protein IKC11_04215 [Clostridia bacterium]|nr:hypothetical protein [Clostridia bacterium]
MAEIKLGDKIYFTRDDLLGLGIYELRELGRDVGVCSPTTLKKENLVDAILAVIYGEAPKRRVGKGRGRPTRRMEKPSKLFLDLLDKTNTPKIDCNVLDDEDEETCFTARVASFGKEYLDDEDEEFGVLAEGIVCEENGGFVVRKYKFVPTENDIKILAETVDALKLKDNDVIEYFSNDGKVVAEVMKINGVSTGVSFAEQKAFSKEKKNEVVENVNIVINEENLVFAKNREHLFEEISTKLNKKGYTVIKLYYDKVSPIGKNIYNKGQMEYYVSTVGDEFETIALTEQTVSALKVLAQTGEKAVLMIDNISWLVSVVESYPSPLYGTFIQKVVGVVKDNVSSATIIAFADNNQKSKDVLSSIFSNKIEL